MSLTATHTTNDFSTQYFRLRAAEGRIYTDEEVALLPVIDKHHRHFKEWVARKASCDRLLKYLIGKKKGLQILEVGCGNGWLAANLASVPGSMVTGIDVNVQELEQANRVFKEVGNLKYINSSLEDDLISSLKPDIIIFAASIQYFSSLKKVLTTAINMLAPFGEIHVLDSNFYYQAEVEAARQRTAGYYESIGFPEMIGQYFHHSMDELALFEHETLYDPHSYINWFKKNNPPFYWIKIKNA